MTIKLTPEDEALLNAQLKQTNAAIAQESAMQEALERELAIATEEEALNEKIWYYYHYIITNYERAIQNTAGVSTSPSGKGGEYITAPISNQDVVNLANNTGRLYQGLVSTMAKVIPELVGGGLAKNLSGHELDNKSDIDTYIGLILTGTGGSASIVSATGGTVLLSAIVGTNVWVLANLNVLALLGTYTVVPASGGPPATPERYLYTVSKTINGSVAPGTIAPWAGYSNTERTSPRVATSTTQSLMNSLAATLANSLTRWLSFVTVVVSAEAANTSPTMTDADRKVSKDLELYLISYIEGAPGAEQLWLQNGSGGIDGLKTEITNRQTVTGPALIARSKTDKGLFYGTRISYTNMRGDIQSGSLTTVFYLTDMLSKYPDPWLQQKKGILEAWTNS